MQEEEILLYEDECSIRDYQAIMKSWFPKGKQRVIPTYGKHHSVKLLGVLNYETGAVLVQQSETFDAQVFKTFLNEVLLTYPTGTITLVLDNARIHHAKLLQPFLADHSRLHLKFLPPYSPNLNRIEGFWKWLKDTCINNVFFETVQQIENAVQNFVEWVNTETTTTINRLCV